MLAERAGKTYEQVIATEDEYVMVNIQTGQQAHVGCDRSPIHSQQFFLHSGLRAELLKRKGIKPWRIYQKPGQAVFIPAGCAHQVCNLADCIKVASDFVSIENVGRCWTVTDEFRQQTKGPDLWREDVLQLKTQLLWAWVSQASFKVVASGPGVADYRNCVTDVLRPVCNLSFRMGCARGTSLVTSRFAQSHCRTRSCLLVSFVARQRMTDSFQGQFFLLNTVRVWIHGRIV